MCRISEKVKLSISRYGPELPTAVVSFHSS